MPCNNSRSRFVIRTITYVLLFGIFSALHGTANSAQEICVVAESDIKSHPTCISLPHLAETLRKSVRRNAQGQALEDVVVHVSEGMHRLAAPVVIDATSWASGGRQLTIEGLGVNKSIVSGSVAASATTLPEAERTNRKLRTGVLQIALKSLGISAPDPLTEFRFGKPVLPDLELFSNGNRLPRSRWPNTGFGTVATVEEQGGLRFTVVGQDVRRYASEPALMLGGYFAHDWADETLRAGSVDASGIRFFQNAPTYGVKVGQRVWFENALSDIDTPGEWAYDPTSQSIYVLPDANQASANFEVSKSPEGIVLRKLWNVVIKDIGFTGFRDAGIRVDEGLDISIKNISIRNSGGVGIRLNGRNVVADGLHVADTGAGGISISGGNRIALTPGRVAVRHCTVERVGRLSKSYKAAVGIAGVGNEISNCRLSDGPHAAILFHGNDHLIEGNLIELFVLETDDAGAIYTGRDWTERGTIIRGNLIRDLGPTNQKYGTNAIYLDDQASGIVVKNNLIVNSNRGVLIGGGRDNQITDNIFLNCKDGIYVDSRGTQEIKTLGPSANTAQRKNFADVKGDSALYTARYPEMLASGISALGNSGNNLSEGNIFSGCTSAYTLKSPAQGSLKITTGYLAPVISSQDINGIQTPQQLPQLKELLTGKSKSLNASEATKEIP